MPLYVCRVSISCDSLVLDSEEAVLASRDPLPGLESGYRFPSTGREAYNPGVYGHVDVFHQVNTPVSTACLTVASRLEPFLRMKAVLAGCESPSSAKHEAIGVVHYPFWLLVYTHPLAPRPLKAVIDAVDARIVHLEYPRSLARRMPLAAISTAGLATAAILGALASSITSLGWPATLAPLASSLLAAGVAVSPGLRRAAGRVGVYTWRSEKEFEPRVRLG